MNNNELNSITLNSLNHKEYDKQLRAKEVEISDQIKVLQFQLKYGCGWVYYCGDLIKISAFEVQLHKLVDL